MGDPDQGKNGYPLPGRCESVVKMAWSGFYERRGLEERAGGRRRRKFPKFPFRPINNALF